MRSARRQRASSRTVVRVPRPHDDRSSRAARRYAARCPEMQSLRGVHPSHERLRPSSSHTTCRVDGTATEAIAMQLPSVAGARRRVPPRARQAPPTAPASRTSNRSSCAPSPLFGRARVASVPEAIKVQGEAVRVPRSSPSTSGSRCACSVRSPQLVHRTPRANSASPHPATLHPDERRERHVMIPLARMMIRAVQ